MKMKERYAGGWSDYRGIFGMEQTPPRIPNVTKGSTKDFADVPNEVLHNLWWLKFNKRGVSQLEVIDMRERDEEILYVMQELINRKHVRYEKHFRMDVLEPQNYYVLEKADGNN